MKKFVSLLLCTVLLLSFAVQTGIAQGTETPAITLTSSSATAKPGEELIITASVTNNPGVSALIVTPNCPEGFEITEYTNGTVLPELTTGSPLVNFLWTISGDAAGDSSANGKLIEFKVKVPSSVEYKDYQISLKFREAWNYDEDSVEFTILPATVKVVAPVSSVSLDKTTASVDTGKQITLTATVLPNEAGNKDVIWSSDNEEIATVENGVVTAKRHGSVTITAASADDSTKFASCVITVNCVHRGGVATCSAQAICDICGQPYGGVDANNHVNTEERNAITPTCTLNGKEADIFCLDCQKTISVGKEILATGEHVDADGKWESDDSNHWHTCGCGKQFDITIHSGGTATCSEKAHCEVCGHTHGELDPDNHTFAEIEDTKYLKEAATCKSFAVYYKSCSGCGLQSTETFYGRTYGDHLFTEEIATTDHLKAAATCVSPAVYFKSCKVCGISGTDTFTAGEINPDNHTNTEERNAVAPECCADGKEADIFCLDCKKTISVGKAIPATGEHVDADGKWESDDLNHWHTCKYNTKFDITPHSGGIATCVEKAHCEVCGHTHGKEDPMNHVGNVNNWKVTVEPTTETAGEKIGNCSGCDVELKVVLDKLISDPVKKENIEYTGFIKVPQLKPIENTLIPENVILAIKNSSSSDFTPEEKDIADKAGQFIDEKGPELLGDKFDKATATNVIDISMLLRQKDELTGATIADEKYNSDGLMQITMEVPELFLASNYSKLVNVDETGACEEVDYTVNEDGTITFNSSKLGSFVLVNLSEKTVPASTTPETNPTSPKTGDLSNVQILFVIMLVSAVMFIAAISLKKKNER